LIKGTPIKKLSGGYNHNDSTYTPSCIPKFTTHDKFVEAKIKMLEEDFKIPLSEKDIWHLREYKTEGEINAAVRAIIDKYWGG
jgi:hypothetical protein